MAWNQCVEVYAFRDLGNNKDAEDVGSIAIDPVKETPLHFAKKLRLLAKAIEDAEKKYPGQVYINTNY